MKRQPRSKEVLDWEELEQAPNTRGAFSFLRVTGPVINIAEHRYLGSLCTAHHSDGR